MPCHARGGQATADRDSDRDAQGEFVHRNPNPHAQSEPDGETHDQVPGPPTHHALTVAGYVDLTHVGEVKAAVRRR